ncbi:PREDICTED: esterase-5B-like isoform X2 [Rhagoletis zephyria]|uniref:esterase-5B-like isoform X1 n=1 Tax=Rhagoletis zephyria TaxID=28612 RepID=UPI000811948F|nr:PREDICTED: esterase-5B-like isoform X1 [Rhagoletis zephyria]XP_017477790.1 PREDICTED: esterase-5B-like isoform X2 [Rhagoletis zephyria]
MHFQFFPFYITVLIYALFSEISGANTNEFDNALIVDLPNGRIRGRDNDYFYSYESIPYAEPPLGPLRFESPRPYSGNWSDTFDATREPIECMQWDQYKAGVDKLHGIEDCLTVNVYKPKLLVEVGCTQASLPVLVLIHGGAFMFGSVRANGHEHFMRNGRVIVVKMGYRLGPLGFLSTEDTVISGNFGMKDQRLALQWIKANIACFGGDPERIMLLGFSSGGVAVHLHILANRNLTEYARVAASFSGVAFNPWAISHKTRERAFELAKNLNCPDVSSSQSIKECLQRKPATAIVRGVKQFLVFGYNPFTTFGPSIEDGAVKDAFLTRFPRDIVESGNFAQLPWLVSYAAQDGGYNAAELLKRSPRREELIEVFNDRWYDLAPYNLFYKDTMKSVEQMDDYSVALKRRYLGDKEFSIDTYSHVQRMYTDVLFRNGVEQAIRLQRARGRSPIYAYVYDNPADEGIGQALSHRRDVKMGTVHGDDFFLMFSNSGRSKIRADEKLISQKFVTMLGNFASRSDELMFGDCKFVDNVKKDEIQLMFITKNACENKEVSTLPSF